MSDNPQAVKVPENGDQSIEVLIKRLKELSFKLNDENIIATLIAHLSSNPGFIGLVRNLSREGVAEYISQSTRDDGDIVTIDDNDSATGYIATVHEQRNENTLLRVGVHSPHHPQHPNGLDIFIRRDGEEDRWENVHLSEKAEAVIKTELSRHSPQVGDYYWIELVVLSRDRINESSREIPQTAVEQVVAETVDEHTNTEG